MSDFRDHLKRSLEDAEIAAEREKIQPEIQVVRALINARISENMTQKDLAEKSGIRQSNISRIESGVCSPTISTLQQLASGMGKKLKIEFV